MARFPIINTVTLNFYLMQASTTASKERNDQDSRLLGKAGVSSAGQLGHQGTEFNLHSLLFTTITFFGFDDLYVAVVDLTADSWSIYWFIHRSVIGQDSVNHWQTKCNVLPYFKEGR